MKSGRQAYLTRQELDVKSDKSFRMPGGSVVAVSTVFYLAIAANLIK